MGSKGGGSSTTTQTNMPPPWATPLFKRSASDAMKLYDENQGFNIYPGSTVAPLSGQTMAGIDALNQSLGLWDTSQTRGQYGNLLNSALGYGQQGTNVDTSYLDPTVSGQYLQQGNPYYRERLLNDVQETNDRIKSLYSGMGRYGSGDFNDAIARNTSNMLLQGLESDFNRERANQMQAMGMKMSGDLSQAGMNDSRFFNSLGAGTNALGAMSGLDQQNFLNALTGSGQAIDVGKNILDVQGQQELSDIVNRWLQRDMQDWTRLGGLQAAAQGAAGPYGTQTATSQTSGGSNPLSAIGALGSLVKK